MTFCYSSLQNNDTEHKKEFVSILQFILIPNLPPTVNGNPDEKWIQVNSCLARYVCTVQNRPTAKLTTMVHQLYLLA